VLWSKRRQLAGSGGRQAIGNRLRVIDDTLLFDVRDDVLSSGRAGALRSTA
jgi:hypothetical protein